MMELQNAEDETYRRRKRRWLSYGRALLTLGILGLITIFLVTVTRSTANHKSDEEEHKSKVLTASDKDQSERIKSLRNDEIGNLKSKRSIEALEDNRVRKSLLSNDEMIYRGASDLKPIPPTHPHSHGKIFKCYHRARGPLSLIAREQPRAV